MSGIERTGSVDGIPEPPGPFNWTVGWNGLVFVSGVRGIDRDERRLELIFQHLEKILDDAGSSLQSVLVSTVYVTDMVGLRPLVNDAYVAAFGDNLPTRTIVEVTGLNQGDSIEIEIIAAQTEPQ